MKTRWLVIAAAALALGAAGSAHAGDAAAGKAKAKSCAACHGADGKGKGKNPPIASLSQSKFVQAMKDYKSGKRSHKAMGGAAKKLSNADIANLAAYYASL